jgi:hypothetical protein
MSDLNEDLSEGLAAELTGSVGMPEQPQDDDILPDNVAADLADQERHFAEKDIPVNNDVDDTREAAEQREVEQEQIQQDKRKVPYGALNEERTKRKSLEAQLQAQTQQLQQLQAQWQAAQQAQQQAQQEAAIPAFEDDPQGHIEAVKQQFKQELENLKNGPAQQQQAAVQHQQVTAAIISLEQQFMASVPDYEQAVDLVQRNADSQIRAMYPQATEQQLAETRAAALNEFSRHCLANGINPAQQIYTKAQELGHKSAGQQRKEPPTSLSNAHGSSRAPDERSNLRAADISSMSESEFDQLWASMSRKGVQRPKI